MQQLKNSAYKLISYKLWVLGWYLPKLTLSLNNVRCSRSLSEFTSFLQPSLKTSEVFESCFEIVIKDLLLVSIQIMSWYDWLAEGQVKGSQWKNRVWKHHHVRSTKLHQVHVDIIQTWAVCYWMSVCHIYHKIVSNVMALITLWCRHPWNEIL